MTVAAEIPGERFVVARPMRVAVGEKREVVEVAIGDPWPENAPGRLDVLIRQGFVVRFDENGEPDPRSRVHVRRLGLEPPPLYPCRSWAQRAAALEQTAVIEGRRIRVYAGRENGGFPDLFVVEGRGYGIRRGAADAPEAREAMRRPTGGGDGSPRRRPGPKGKNRRRRRKE